MELLLWLGSGGVGVSHINNGFFCGPVIGTNGFSWVLTSSRVSNEATSTVGLIHDLF